MRALIAATVLAFAVAAPAAAQLARGQGVPLAKKEVEAALFGIDMMGFSPTYRMSWRECITPTGETLYETPLGVQKGRLRIADDGTACFSYLDTNYQVESCYSVVRNGKGYMFHHDGDGGVFVTTRLVTGVRNCDPDPLVS